MEEREGTEGTEASREERRVVYCLVPYELADTLHEPLRRHFRDLPDIQVIVEQRRRERRASRERRRDRWPVGARGSAEGAVPPDGVGERRRVLSATGRRVAERRAPQQPVSPPSLPRRARRHEERLAFVERYEPATVAKEDLDSARLVARFQAGDREVFAALYARYYDRVYGYLRTALRDSYEAEDAAQEAFIKVMEALPAYERRRQPFRAWLFTIVRNQAVDVLRRMGRIEVVDPAELANQRAEEAIEEPQLNVIDWLTDQDLTILTERLPDTQRQVLVLRFLLDLSDRQIAEIMNRSPSDIRALQYRALSFLRKRLAALGREPQSDRRSQWRRRVKQAPVLRSRRHALDP